MRRDFLKLMLGGVSLLAIAGCATKDPRFKTYSGPPVTRIDVFKSRRLMLFYSGSRAIKAHNFGLGYAPVGNKEYEGDGKTPEGLYYIDRRNPDSRYHLSVGVSYPNPQDSALAASVGRSAGSDIFIHGQGPEGRALSKQKADWTAGCIAVSDAEIEDVYAMIPDGTPILITP